MACRGNILSAVSSYSGPVNHEERIKFIELSQLKVPES